MKPSVSEIGLDTEMFKGGNWNNFNCIYRSTWLEIATLVEIKEASHKGNLIYKKHE